MQVYKKLLILALSTSLVYAQSSTQLDFPSVSSPSMPSVSSPVIGKPFYTPGSYYNDASSSSSASDDSTDTKDKSQTSADLSLSTLTAGDLADLTSMGLNLNSLLTDTDTSTASRLMSNLYTSDRSNETNELLKKVLTQLEDLKKQYNTQSAAKEEASRAVSDIKKYNPHILRFSVNGYNLLDTCRTVYISKQAKDGSFLITGDRLYTSDGVNRSETFYIMFKADGVYNGKETFTTATAVTQDYLNQYSFLYQLSKKDNLTAEKTGSFITMRTSDPSWALDLLIDVGEQ